MSLYSELDITALQEVIAYKRSYLKTMKQEISDISQEISFLRREDQDVAETDFQRLMATLNNQLKLAANLENSIAIHTAMLPSPIQLLPVEILSYILVLCMESTLFPDWRDLSLPPFVFGRVCSLFRFATLSTPQVWSAVSIHIIPGRKWETLFNLFLTRSGGRPLRLELIWHPARGDAYIKSVSAILEELAPLISSRIQKLQLFVPDHALSVILGSHPLPMLEYLSLGSQNDDPVPFLSASRPGSAPNLRTLFFATPHSKLLMWKLPWSQLTELNSKSRLTGSQVLRLFAQCPSLERCRLRVGRYDPNPSDQDPDRLIALPHLQSLVFIIDSKEDCFGLFYRLVLPRLSSVEFQNATTRLDLGQYYDTRVWPKHFLTELVDRSGCTLTNLVLVGFLVHERELRDTVRCIPSLVEVEASHRWDIVPADLRELLLARRWGEMR